MREDSTIKCFGEYYMMYIYDGDKKYKNPEFINGVGKHVIDVKNNKSEGIEFFVKEIVDYLKDKEDIDSITCVPSSKERFGRCGMNIILNEVSKKLIKSDKMNIYCLKRTCQIDKLSFGGNRSKDTHKNSIEVVNKDQIRGKVIYLFDDITTTGNLLNICKELLLNAGAKKVYCLALAKTVNKMYTANDVRDAMIFTEIDLYVKNTMDEELEKDNIINSLIKKYRKLNNYFIKVEKNIYDTKYLYIRIRETYSYLLEQLKKYNELEYYYSEWEPKCALLEILICETLVNKCNSLSHLDDLFKVMKMSLLKFGSEFDYRQYEDIFGESHIYKIDENSMRYFSPHGIYFDIGSLAPFDLSNYIDNYKVARAYYNADDEIMLKSALIYIERAIKFNGNNKILYYVKGLILIKMGNINEAFNTLKVAANLEVNYNENVFLLNQEEQQIEKFLREINSLCDSVESNYALAMHIRDFKLGTSFRYYLEYNNRYDYEDNFKGTYNILPEESEFIRLINRVNEKKGVNCELTELDTVMLTFEKYKTKEKVYNKEIKNNIYFFSETLIDKLVKIKNKMYNENYDYYNEIDGPDWLGGCETEAEFWEH